MQSTRTLGRRTCTLIGLAGTALAAVTLVSACGSPKREVKTSDAPQVPLRDVPEVLRGTIGAEASIRGIEPVLVSGLGIVVGLNGTGGGELPVQVRATMERELAKGGIGKGAPGSETVLGPVSPQEFLRSPNVAVVIVQAAVPPGAPRGSTFDVFVRALPGSSVTSLEGGRLWTTDLRFGEPAVFGAIKTRKLAEANGSVFINPFSPGGSGGADGGQVTRTIGRVMGGGVVTDPLAMEMILDNESHARARSVVSAINSRFPGGPGDRTEIAKGRGRTGPQENALQSIALTVPEAYKERAGEFIQLVRHLRIDQGFQQEYARKYVEELKNKPALSGELSWALQAVGKSAIPFVQGMYDYPELTPRLAALEAGARLGDQRAAPPLIELAKSGPPGLRTQAIKLMRDLPGNPSIDLALRELVTSPDLDIRVAAYEGMRERNDRIVLSVPVGPDPRTPKFWLDLVPGGEEMVYVTQQGTPRIVLFGAQEPRSISRAGKVSGLKLNKPMTMSAWDDRLMMAADDASGPVRLIYRDPRSSRPMQFAKVPDDAAELVQFLSQRGQGDDPMPGLSFGYSDVVGAMYEMTRQGALSATFSTEEDRLRAEVYEASQGTSLVDRPETTEGEGKPEFEQVFKSLEPANLPSTGSEARPGKLTKVVPLAKPAKKGEK